MICEISDNKELIRAIEGSKALIIYFYNDNCAPCMSLRPKIQHLIEIDFPKMSLIYVNSQLNPHINSSYGVYSNPPLLIIFEGHEHSRESKYLSIPLLKEQIQRPYNMIFT